MQMLKWNGFINGWFCKKCGSKKREYKRQRRIAKMDAKFTELKMEVSS